MKGRCRMKLSFLQVSTTMCLMFSTMCTFNKHTQKTTKCMGTNALEFKIHAVSKWGRIVQWKLMMTKLPFAKKSKMLYTSLSSRVSFKKQGQQL